MRAKSNRSESMPLQRLRHRRQTELGVHVLHNRHAGTRRLAQSMIATKYRNPPCTGM